MSNAFMNAVKPKGKAAKFATVGDSVTIQLTSEVTEQQARTYVPGGQGEPKFFPKSGDPIMDQVISGLDVNAETEEDAPTVIYVDKPAQRQAIGKALLEANVDNLHTGGTLELTFSGYGVGRVASQPPKAFTAKYWAPQAAAGSWGGEG